MSDLPKRLRIKASMIALGERIAWGSDTALMEEAADVIEGLSASVENHQLHMLGMARDRDQLRALLTAQPQAGAAIPFAGYDPRLCPGSNPENPQTKEEEPEQSAPAGEREAFRAWQTKDGWKRPDDPGELEAFQAGAAWQRTQSAGVPEGWRGLLDRIVPRIDAGGPNPIDQEIHHCEWALYQERERIHAEFESVLAAAQAQPAAQGEFGDAYQGAREDLAIWKRRALEAEARVRHQDQIIDQMGEDLNAINGPTFMGEPVIPASHDQGEVQRLRDWIACKERLPADKRDVMVYCADSDEHMVGSSIGGGLFLFATASHGEKVVCRPTHWRYIDESDKPDLAASTGQEVKP